MGTSTASFRSFRGLQYALQGSLMETFNPKASFLQSPSLAYDSLRQLWPSGSSDKRYLFWPAEVPCTLKNPIIGDIGIFEVPEGCGHAQGSFRKLCDVRRELGGVHATAAFHLEGPWTKHLPKESYDLGVIRRVRPQFSVREPRPEAKIDSFKITPDPPSEEHGLKLTPLGGCLSGDIESHSHGMMKWHCSLTNQQQVWDYFRRHARAIAAQHNVSPEDLVFGKLMMQKISASRSQAPCNSGRKRRRAPVRVSRRHRTERSLPDISICPL